MHTRAKVAKQAGRGRPQQVVTESSQPIAKSKRAPPTRKKVAEAAGVSEHEAPPTPGRLVAGVIFWLHARFPGRPAEVMRRLPGPRCLAGGPHRPLGARSARGRGVMGAGDARHAGAQRRGRAQGLRPAAPCRVRRAAPGEHCRADAAQSRSAIPFRGHEGLAQAERPGRTKHLGVAGT